MSDHIIRALTPGLRALACSTTDTVAEIVRRQDAGPLGAQALGRTATAALLLGATLKGGQQVGVQITGDGPLGQVYAVADAKGHVRVSVGDARAEAPDLAEALGQGRFTVVRKLQDDAPAYTGVVPIVYGEVAQDLSEYLWSSEQVHSSVGLGELLDRDGVRAAGGFMIQAMPGADEAELKAVEARIAALPTLGQAFADLSPKEILEAILGDFEVVAEYPVSFRCPCERARYARILLTLGPEELERLREEDEVTELECHFCRETYTFDREEMGALIYGAKRELEKLRR